MKSYDDWYNRIDNLITMMSALPYWNTVRVDLTMSDLLELRMIVTICKQYANEKAKNYKEGS